MTKQEKYHSLPEFLNGATYIQQKDKTLDISTALQEVGFPVNTDEMKFDLFFTKSDQKTTGGHIDIKSVPILNDEMLLLFVQCISEDLQRDMEHEVKYGLHFNFEGKTTFTVDDAPVKKVGTLHGLWDTYRSSTMARVYHDMETVINAAAKTEKILANVDHNAKIILSYATLQGKLDNVRPLCCVVTRGCLCDKMAVLENPNSIPVSIPIGHGNVFAGVVQSTIECSVNSYLGDKERSYMRSVSSELAIAAAILHEASEA